MRPLFKDTDWIRVATLLVCALVLAILLGYAYFWYAYLYLNRWPSQEQMVESGYPMLPEARQIDDLFGPARHRASNYEEPDIVEWQSEVLFGGRYVLIMCINVEVDRHSNAFLNYGTGNVVRVVGKPRFVLSEVRQVTLLSDGRIEVDFQDHWEFGLQEWKKLVAAKGDFSVIGVRVNRNNPVPNFDKYKNYPTNGVLMK